MGFSLNCSKKKVYPLTMCNVAKTTDDLLPKDILDTEFHDNLSAEGKFRFEDLIKVRNIANRTVKTSKKNSNRANKIFRLIGISLVFSSVSIPFLLNQVGYWKSIVLPIMSFLVTFLASINSFFDFKGTWGKSRQAQYFLRFEIILWEEEISKAQYECIGKEKEFLIRAEKVTKNLMNKWRESVENRAMQYFEEQVFSLPD